MHQEKKPLKVTMNRNLNQSHMDLNKQSNPEILNKTADDRIEEKIPKLEEKKTERIFSKKKSLEPIIGYAGHIRQLNSANIVGSNFKRAREKAKSGVEFKEQIRFLEDTENKVFSKAYEANFNQTDRVSFENRKLMGRTMPGKFMSRNAWK